MEVSLDLPCGLKLLWTLLIMRTTLARPNLHCYKCWFLFLDWYWSDHHTIVNRHLQNWKVHERVKSTRKFIPHVALAFNDEQMTIVILSRLYSEKAYVLSRSFVRTALERPPSGLEGEIRHLYLEKGRLTAVIEHARTLMEKREVATGGEGSGSISGRNGSGSGQAGGGADGSGLEEENEEMWNADAMGSLTMGAILSLKVGWRSCGSVVQWMMLMWRYQRIISAMEKILIQGGRE